MTLLLASSSPYRRELLSKLGLAFECCPPDVDEEILKQKLLSEKKSAGEIAAKLSLEKALSVFEQRQNPNELIISGDQLISHEQKILGKPLSFDKAVQQLQSLRGKTHQLITALTLLSAKTQLTYTHITKLKMKNLSDGEIKNYVTKDQPLDCAGSYKIEKNGLILFESIDCDDFSAIQGIPMIWLSNRLKEYGYEFFQN